MTTFNHAFDVAFAVPGCEYEDWADVLEHEKDKVLAALRERVAFLESNEAEFREAISGFDSFEEEQDGS